MTRWPVLLLALGACTEATAPTVDCQGELAVTITVTRFGQDTTVACVFPPPPPPDTVIVTPPPDTVFLPKPRHRHDHDHHGGHDD